MSVDARRTSFVRRATHSAPIAEKPSEKRREKTEHTLQDLLQTS
jgi:hypothetical protein